MKKNDNTEKRIKEAKIIIETIRNDPKLMKELYKLNF